MTDAVEEVAEEPGEPPHLAFAIVFRSVFVSSPTGFPRSTGAQGLVAALFVASDAYFYTRLVQLTHLASHHAIAATYAQRDFAEAGGLMSYGTNITDAYRQIGVYTGRILKGAKPAEG